MRALFIGSLLLLLFTYAGYPLLMAVWARLRRRPVRFALPRTSFVPSVSVVIPGRDEARVIGKKIASVLAQGWPADRLQLIVVDDGSRDGTAEAARRAADCCNAAIEVIELAAPSGKAAALNAGVAA